MVPKPVTYEQRKDSMEIKEKEQDDESFHMRLDYQGKFKQVNQWIKCTESIELEMLCDIGPLIPFKLANFSHSYEASLRKLLKQKSRIAQTSKKIKTILQIKSKVNSQIKYLEKDLNIKKEQEVNLIRDGDKTLETLNKIKQQMNENHSHFMGLMSSHEDSLSSRVLTEYTVCALKKKLQTQKRQLHQCDSLLPN